MDGKLKVRAMTILMDEDNPENIVVLSDNLKGDGLYGKDVVEFLEGILDYCKKYSGKLEKQYCKQGWESDN